MNATAMFLPWAMERQSPVVGSGGGLFTLPEGLKQTQNAAVLVDELRFDPVLISGLGTIRATISVGRQSICNDVPLDVLCKPLDFSANFNNFAVSARVLRFVRPLYLPDNGQINVGLRFVDPTGGAHYVPIAFNVMVVGRTLPSNFPAPAYIDVPFGSFWQPPASAVNFIAQSTPTDLKNGLAEDLEVKRFTFLPVGNAGTFNQLDNLAASGNAKLQLFGSNGLLGVRDQTPAGALMHLGRLAWGVNSILPAGGFYIADLDYTVRAGFSSVVFYLGMFGSRKIPYAELGV